MIFLFGIVVGMIAHALIANLGHAKERRQEAAERQKAWQKSLDDAAPIVAAMFPVVRGTDGDKLPMKTVMAERDELHSILAGMAHDPGWSADPRAHLDQMQKEIREGLRKFHLAPNRNREVA